MYSIPTPPTPNSLTQCVQTHKINVVYFDKTEIQLLPQCSAVTPTEVYVYSNALILVILFLCINTIVWQ